MLPREKIQSKGCEVLKDYELVGAIVGSGIKGHSFRAIGRTVVKCLRRRMEKGKRVDLEQLAELKGVGIAKGAQILAGIELGRRLYGLLDGKKVIRSSEDVVAEVKELKGKKQEYFVGLFLNARYELIGTQVVGIGTLDRVGVLPRDVLIPALEMNCASVIIAHNHPSGSCEPSDEDYAVTKRIKEALDLVGFTLLDHIIVSTDTWCSAMSKV